MIPNTSVGNGLKFFENVLDLLLEAHLKLNLRKYLFLKTNINYLGQEIPVGTIQLVPTS